MTAAPPAPGSHRLPRPPSRLGRPELVLGSALLGLTLMACGTGGRPTPSSQPRPTPATTIVAAPVPVGPTTAPVASSSLQLITEPEDGLGPVYALLGAPEHRLDLALYELVDSQAEAILAADAARGVHVRVILDASLERSRNQAAYDYLTGRGVAVKWSTAFHAFHEKAFVLDGRRTVVMSLNLASRYYSDTRDLALVDPDGADAAAVEAVFEGDWSGRPQAHPPTGSDLVWSPGAEPVLARLVAGAQRRVVLENEELSNSGMVTALVDAARRGVQVAVVMVDRPDYQAQFRRLSAAGATVWLVPESVLYIHAKALVVDGRQAFVGSENLSTASLDYDRELGVVTGDGEVVAQVGRVLQGDEARGRQFRD